MKRWIVYLLVVLGIHAYHVLEKREYNKALIKQIKYNGVYSPNWVNPKTDDIFMTKDTLGVIRYYQIVDGLKEDRLSLKKGKYDFSTGPKEGFNDEKWNYKFLNDSLLYKDAIQQFSLKEFLQLKEQIYLTKQFRMSEKKSRQNFLLEYSHYLTIMMSLLAFFMIWLFGFLNSYLSAFFRFSEQSLLSIFVVFTFLVMFVVFGDTYPSEYPEATFFIFGKGLVYAFSLLYLIRFINNKLIRNWNFADQEAVKFVVLLVLGTVFSLLGGYIEFVIFKFFDIKNFTDNSSLQDIWQFHIAPFMAFFWLALATGNFLNNFRKHFFQLRRKAKAFKYAQKQELEFKSELETLQAKINPHFLYNSLNSIASLAQTDPQKTESMALALSKFYKEKTNRKERVWSTVAEEMDMLRTYLAIEKIRFGDRLEVELNSSENAGVEKIPRFLLQPLIENAIKYGYNTDDNKIIVKIEVERSNRMLTIRIIDSGPYFSDELDTGYGIRSVQKKLKLFYPDNHQMEFINRPEKQVFIQIENLLVIGH